MRAARIKLMDEMMKALEGMCLDGFMFVRLFVRFKVLFNIMFMEYNCNIGCNSSTRPDPNWLMSPINCTRIKLIDS